jgi:Fe-S-cluster containining protein
MEWDDVVEPDIYSCLSDGEAFLAIGWILQRNDAGACIFHANGKCSIYSWRPLICRCYPFFLKEYEVDIMHCDGLNRKITEQNAISQGKLLKRFEIKKLQSYIRIINQLGERLKLTDLCMLPENFSGEVDVFDGESISTCHIDRNINSYDSPGSTQYTKC